MSHMNQFVPAHDADMYVQRVPQQHFSAQDFWPAQAQPRARQNYSEFQYPVQYPAQYPVQSQVPHAQFPAAPMVPMAHRTHRTHRAQSSILAPRYNQMPQMQQPQHPTAMPSSSNYASQAVSRTSRTGTLMSDGRAVQRARTMSDFTSRRQELRRLLNDCEVKARDIEVKARKTEEDRRKHMEDLYLLEKYGMPLNEEKGNFQLTHTKLTGLYCPEYHDGGDDLEQQLIAQLRARPSLNEHLPPPSQSRKKQPSGPNTNSAYIRAKMDELFYLLERDRAGPQESSSTASESSANSAIPARPVKETEEKPNRRRSVCASTRSPSTSAKLASLQ